MQTITRVALDAMGGDNAPQAPVQGAVDAVCSREDIIVYLVGKEDLIAAELKKYQYPADKIIVVNADEVIETAEHPVMAIRRKKQSSMVIALKLVKEGQADAFVSAGNSGAVLAGGQFIVGRIRGISRTPFAPLIPTRSGITLIADAGANVDVKPEHLVQFAQMGSIYMEHVVGIPNPRVAIVNIGAEEEKGNALVKEAMPLLKACPGINFIGSIEAREIANGYADVIVCDGFVGNVILKLYEGLATTLIDIIKKGLKSTFRSKIGALLALPALKTTLKDFDASKYGGAPMLGLNGLVVKTHGSAKPREITNTILQCVAFNQQEINSKIKANILGKTDKAEESGKEETGKEETGKTEDSGKS